MPTQQSWIPAQSTARATLVSRDEYLKDEVARIAAAAAIPFSVVPDLHDVADPGAGHVVLVDPDSARKRPHAGGLTVLVGTTDSGVDLWSLGARISAHHVAVLPDAAAWLVERFSRSMTAESSGHTVGILGASGGSGASTLSCWLAQAAAAAGHSTLLVDGDHWGAGLELSVGAERLPGVRWQDVREVRGTVTPVQLGQSLPSVGGFNLLSWRRTEPGEAPVFPPAEPVTAVMDAGRQGHDLTVVDLGRLWTAESSLLAHCQSFVLVVPAQVRAIMAARQLGSALSPVTPLALVRGPLAADIDERMVADSLKLPLAGYLPSIRGTRAASDKGQILAVGRHRLVRRVARSLLTELAIQRREDRSE